MQICPLACLEVHFSELLSVLLLLPHQSNQHPSLREKPLAVVTLQKELSLGCRQQHCVHELPQSCRQVATASSCYRGYVAEGLKVQRPRDLLPLLTAVSAHPKCFWGRLRRLRVTGRGLVQLLVLKVKLHGLGWTPAAKLLLV